MNGTIADLTSRSLDIFLAVENLLVMLVALLGNLIMCVAGIRLMRRKFASNVFIFSLALSDLSLSTFQLPLVVACLLNRRDYPVSGLLEGILCNSSGVIYFWVRQVSFFAVCSIAIDRYLALRFPLKYKILLTYQRSIIVTVLSWVFCFATTLIPFFHGTHYVYNPMFIYCMWDIFNSPSLKIYVDIIFFPTFLISNAILAFTSVINIIKLHQLARKGRQQNLGSTASLLRASRTALIVVLAFTLCYTPRYIQAFFKPQNGSSESVVFFYLRSISEMMIYLNSALNPLIYIFRSRQYIAEISAIFGSSLPGGMAGLQSLNGGATAGGVPGSRAAYHSIPMGIIVGKTTELLNVPRGVLEKTSPRSSPRHSRLVTDSVVEESGGGGGGGGE